MGQFPDVRLESANHQRGPDQVAPSLPHVPKKGAGSPNIGGGLKKFARESISTFAVSIADSLR
jgi:hypothetical protein